MLVQVVGTLLVLGAIGLVSWAIVMGAERYSRTQGWTPCSTCHRDPCECTYTFE